MTRSSDISHLEHKIECLSTLIEVNGLTSSSLNLDHILENVMTISKKVMNANAVARWNTKIRKIMTKELR